MGSGNSSANHAGSRNDDIMISATDRSLSPVKQPRRNDYGNFVRASSSFRPRKDPGGDARVEAAGVRVEEPDKDQGELVEALWCAPSNESNPQTTNGAPAEGGAAPCEDRMLPEPERGEGEAASPPPKKECPRLPRPPKEKRNLECAKRKTKSS